MSLRRSGSTGTQPFSPDTRSPGRQKSRVVLLHLQAHFFNASKNLLLLIPAAGRSSPLPSPLGRITCHLHDRTVNPEDLVGGCEGAGFSSALCPTTQVPCKPRLSPEVLSADFSLTECPSQ